MEIKNIYDDVHIIFGEICGIAILHDYDIPSYYYMVFLVEDDDYWYIEKDINYSNFYWVNDYAKVIIKAVEYRNKLLGKESIDEDKFNKILEDAKIAFNEENNFEDIDKSFVQGMNFGFSSGFKMCYKKNQRWDFDSIGCDNIKKQSINYISKIVEETISSDFD